MADDTKGTLASLRVQMDEERRIGDDEIVCTLHGEATNVGVESK